MSRRTSALVILASAILAAVVFLAWRWTHRPWRPSNPELLSVATAAKELHGPSVFFTQAARAVLAETHPNFIPEGTRDALSDTSRKMAQAVQDPALFRELNRTLRFPEIWLAGDPSTFKPLLEHLLDTKDFNVVYIDHSSIILRPDAPADWKPGDPGEAAARFTDPRDRAYFLSQAAVRLIAIHRPDAATRWLDLAEKNDATLPDVWVAKSTQRAAKGDWDEALRFADQALSLRKDFLPAIACKAQALYAVKRFSQAHDLSTILLDANPDDPALLFYHAKLSHEAKAYTSEIRALRRLIELAELAGANVSGYRVYLAQAYAGFGDADNAMDQVTLALLDTTLPREQRQFADELLTKIKQSLK